LEVTSLAFAMTGLDVSACLGHGGPAICAGCWALALPAFTSGKLQSYSFGERVPRLFRKKRQHKTPVTPLSLCVRTKEGTLAVLSPLSLISDLSLRFPPGWVF
jgi:hypothetical protein